MDDRLKLSCLTCKYRIGYYCTKKKRDTDDDGKCPYYKNFWKEIRRYEKAY